MSELREAVGKKEKSIQSFYPFHAYVFPKTGYPAVVLRIDVSTSTREGKGEEGGGRRGGRGGKGRLWVGGGGGRGGRGGQGWVGGERRPATPWES